ncbi:hypothetical protein NUW58_g133 [Xylaria curta]|uniref:Uncharacterized protein n=1 Tax=Xylaria curta TaxID=42375 RepID=A0ACC1PQC4_9PEZI|nr:hypothetical protein NUW58_g133 [Xylaria curta]
MAFAIVSIASGQASFARQRRLDCNGGFDAPGLLNEWADGMPPLLEFGSMSHQPGKPPGVSPTGTMYWLNGVLVSLVLVIDGDAFTKAIAWGMEKGRSNFRIVIMTLFGVAFGEVEGSQLKISDPIYFSPLRAEYSPRTRRQCPPKLVYESELNSVKDTGGNRIRFMYNEATIQHLQSNFVGLVALVNFFEAAANCHAASNSRGRLPVELYDRILDFVDCETWKNCSLVSDEMRESCLRKYRVDDLTAVVAGPFLRQRRCGRGVSFSFDFEDLRTGEIFPLVRSGPVGKRNDACWVPLIGGDQKALMLESPIYFNLQRRSKQRR